MIKTMLGGGLPRANCVNKLIKSGAIKKISRGMLFPDLRRSGFDLVGWHTAIDYSPRIEQVHGPTKYLHKSLSSSAMEVT
jgi:hypothetical protein